MSINTFEQALKEVIKTELTALMSDEKRSIVISNDVNFDPLEDDPNSIVGIIKSGIGRKSYITGYDMTSYSMNMTFILDVNFLQTFLGYLNSYIISNNGVFKTTTINVLAEVSPREYNYQIQYSTPSVFGTPTDIRSGKNTLKVIIVNLMGEVNYTSNADILPPTIKFKIDSVEYDVKGLLEYDFTDNPVKEPLAMSGEDYNRYLDIVKCKVYTFTIAKIESDSLHDVLHSTFINRSIADFKLKIGSNSYINIGQYSITEMYTNRTILFKVILTR